MAGLEHPHAGMLLCGHLHIQKDGFTFSLTPDWYGMVILLCGHREEALSAPTGRILTVQPSNPFDILADMIQIASCNLSGNGSCP